MRANGQQLGERKTWLHDDYVKFIRLAQWHVEQAGCGIVGYVTNHGYLDNATFRLMRQELMRVFPQIQIVDLHGNRKKHETARTAGATRMFLASIKAWRLACSLGRRRSPSAGSELNTLNCGGRGTRNLSSDYTGRER